MVRTKTKNGDIHSAFDILVPNVTDDLSIRAIVTYMRKVFEQDESGQRVNLIEGGSLELDPDTIEVASDSSGLLLLSKSSDKVNSLDNSIQRSIDLSKEILGILEMDERW